MITVPADGKGNPEPSPSRGPPRQVAVTAANASSAISGRKHHQVRHEGSFTTCLDFAAGDVSRRVPVYLQHVPGGRRAGPFTCRRVTSVVWRFADLEIDLEIRDIPIRNRDKSALRGA